ncbi:MAG: 50S ribosomal protein L4, partial [Bacteroidetes bacterium]|nr:50S ribosomal protein L4 [Bacteroidota bacterium]
PHLYKKDLNVKVRRLARKSALTYKAVDGRIMVVEDFHAVTAETPKTKEVDSVLRNLGLKSPVSSHSTAKKSGKKKDVVGDESVKKSKRITKVLMLVDKAGVVNDEKAGRAYENFKKSCRNIPGLKVGVVRDISTYDIMNSDILLFHESALKSVGAAFGAE